MAIQVVIKRKVKQGRQAKELVPLILQMRTLAMCQPGYISAKTLCLLCLFNFQALKYRFCQLVK